MHGETLKLLHAAFTAQFY